MNTGVYISWLTIFSILILTTLIVPFLYGSIKTYSVITLMLAIAALILLILFEEKFPTTNIISPLPINSLTPIPISPIPPETPLPPPEKNNFGKVYIITDYGSSILNPDETPVPPEFNTPVPIDDCEKYKCGFGPFADCEDHSECKCIDDGLLGKRCVNKDTVIDECKNYRCGLLGNCENDEDCECIEDPDSIFNREICVSKKNEIPDKEIQSDNSQCGSSTRLALAQATTCVFANSSFSYRKYRADLVIANKYRSLGSIFPTCQSCIQRAYPVAQKNDLLFDLDEIDISNISNSDVPIIDIPDLEIPEIDIPDPEDFGVKFITKFTSKLLNDSGEMEAAQYILKQHDTPVTLICWPTGIANLKIRNLVKWLGGDFNLLQGLIFNENNFIEVDLETLEVKLRGLLDIDIPPILPIDPSIGENINYKDWLNNKTLCASYTGRFGNPSPNYFPNECSGTYIKINPLGIANNSYIELEEHKDNYSLSINSIRIETINPLSEPFESNTNYTIKYPQKTNARFNFGFLPDIFPDFWYLYPDDLGIDLFNTNGWTLIEINLTKRKYFDKYLIRFVFFSGFRVINYWFIKN